MPDPSKMDMEAKLYFNSLPPILQEQLMQSTAELNTKEDLMRYCANALGRDASSAQNRDKREGAVAKCSSPFSLPVGKTSAARIAFPLMPASGRQCPGRFRSRLPRLICPRRCSREGDQASPPAPLCRTPGRGHVCARTGKRRGDSALLMRL